MSEDLAEIIFVGLSTQEKPVEIKIKDDVYKNLVKSQKLKKIVEELELFKKVCPEFEGNTMEEPFMYNPELFGVFNLIPFKNIKEEKGNEKEDETKSVKGETFENLEKYHWGDDPLKFVQNFLLEVQKADIFWNRQKLVATWLKYLSIKARGSITGHTGNGDPDELIVDMIFIFV